MATGIPRRSVYQEQGTGFFWQVTPGHCTRRNQPRGDVHIVGRVLGMMREF